MTAMRRARSAALLFALLAGPSALAQTITLPNKDSGVRFLVMGDTGRGDSGQYETARMMATVHGMFPFTFVVMVGDNMYGADTPGDYVKKFETPYKPLMDKGVKFYAALGNHDNPNQRFYKQFNMNGERFYTFRGSAGGLAKLTEGGVRFFAIDSNYLDKDQLAWLEKELAASGSDWKIMYFHHPIYSSGGAHGSDTALRDQLEPLFLKYGVDVVLAGHEHFYERLKPQKGIHYFISGGAGKVRKGDVGGEFTEKAYDTGYHFMIFEIEGDKMHFQAISDQGKTVDSGIVERRRVDDKAAPSVPAAPPAKPVPPQDKPNTSTAKPAAPSAGAPSIGAPATAKPTAKPQGVR